MTGHEDEACTFATLSLPGTFNDVAQDGSRYDGLLGIRHGWLSDCRLMPHTTTRAVRHLAHDEIWFVRAGSGQVWRSLHGHDESVDVAAGTCLTIPAGTAFQSRTGPDPLQFLIMQAPPWPPEPQPAFEYAEGPWPPNV